MKIRLLLILISLTAGLMPTMAAAQCQIIRATYGAGHRQADVTSRVQGLARGGQLNFQVSNAVFGDPAPNQVKTLHITCGDWRGRNHTQRFSEGQVVNISVVGPSYYPGGTWNRPNPGYRDLRIIEATYGHRHRVRDVTDRLNAMIRGPVVTFQVSNVNMGGRSGGWTD